MATATWDQANNCIQQKEGNLLGRALNDLDIYDLQTKQTGKPHMMVVVDTTGISRQVMTPTTPMHHMQPQTILVAFSGFQNSV